MSYFKAKMHLIRFAVLPDPLAGFKGPTSKERDWRKDMREGQKGKMVMKGREGKVREGRGGAGK